MPLYTVNATVSCLGWVAVEADNEDEALREARDVDARDFELATDTATVEFNVTPMVEPA